ncbi:MAG: hypothetical protein GXX84_10350 [Acidobacteria bacterium]|nr:hypothetical protein [Acidobacteriota bacterium]
MEKLARRTFCGTALLGFPLLYLQAKEIGGLLEGSKGSDPIMESISQEFYRITADGAANGYRPEHFRRYAGIIKTFDAHMEATGINREFDQRLDDNDHHRMNPHRTARDTVRYWETRGIYLNQDDLAGGLVMDPITYRRMKKAIRKQGGIRNLHDKIAAALEQKAKECEKTALKGGAVIRNGRLGFPTLRQPEFVNAQLPFDLSMSALLGTNMHCLCKAMLVEGALLAVVCAVGIVPVCAPAAALLVVERLLESFNFCDPGKC